ncbi:hypothetical protein AWC38_SpisGene12366 [Stylophora pistillata]|uniref:Uncharacterized protein n=1 Tax=Stylophora pistillata TaxID=50429 RepID=A0A2B4S3G9_STYPI|nr:hypothetical protein AWC38_SpisGene12366 [Stylophora pistillata]
MLDYTIEFIPGKENVYADFLSRKPIDAEPSQVEEVTVSVMFTEGDQFVNAPVVAVETKEDSRLSKVLQYTQNGWPEHPEQSCAVFDPGNTVTVVPGHGKHIGLSLRRWKERRSHKEHGANPVEENEPEGQGSVRGKCT